MKIYTKTGDAGDTALFGGGRVAKSDPRVAAYGDVDELNAWIGVARAHLAAGEGAMADLAVALERVQQDLFVVGAVLATPNPARRKGSKFELPEERTLALEREIDGWESALAPLESFILPGGGDAGAALHAARAVCRRAERAIVGLVADGSADDLPATLLPYVNRLSDWLFVCARVANDRAGERETTW
ncbi:MAG TPA: cob(I)yrinic acid a,c-diamide adenosyltransferase [Gemmatimonadota bacterium]|nr:cob(I)yrinic acid a,c-diamide adenosyltransferase [Gemmatimonadota bacterium]